MGDKASQMVRSAVQQYMKDSGLNGFVVDAVMTFSLLTDDGSSELIVAGTDTPIWILRGMMAEAEEMILSVPYYEEDGEE